ncbi:16S rRNA (uracil(1498)-N(3))-methyltransferase [Zeaxanthinibacter enoshimensis]|uniref:Ribosomal RNA small subunit methyltransferase E n=1 Tax=Zeaxanthinibacter enoshimensis TaxID=392009 RepID=A0A4R6TJS0_9FLAO|nr:16S rRNA (uracil(1498)-N(3))-methyltransferase [Zeaxanthinibacter enoshimensis]TDQ31134.1 16S rRNA (uracil1498-N3)-methyltransferase [Zeaxanthinibacter enoshimensis]
MQLFYNPDLTEENEQFQFDREESKHIVKVLRKKEGDTLYITNGKGYLFKASIEVADHNKCRVKVLDHQKKYPRRYRLHLAVAPTKNNNRYEWFLEKVTEIGVDEITPLICERSERTSIKTERMEKVILNAMKQSQRVYLPKLNEPTSFEEFIKNEHEGLRFIAHCEDDEKMDMKRRVAPDTNITLLIGPEGDFTSTEIKKAYQEQFIPVSLGDSRLRTETAAIVGCTTVTLANTI